MIMFLHYLAFNKTFFRHGHHRFSSHHHRSGSGGNREEAGKSGRSTPQGKQKIMKKLPNAYSTPP